MTTGYVAPVLEGCSFEEFALRCAGAFIGDRNIPDKLEPDSYYEESLNKFMAKARQLETMTEAEAEAEALAEHTGLLSDIQRWNDERNARVLCMCQMHEKVVAWNCPEENMNLKAFMLSQLEECIIWDKACDISMQTPKTGMEWLHNARTNVRNDIISYNDKLTEHRAYCIKMNNWLTALRGSLK